MWVEIIGYLSTVLVVVSFMMKDILKLRIVNMCGGISWIVYGFMLSNTPIIITNVFLVAINIVMLYKFLVVKEK
jgi:hypothetical protein